VREKLLGLLGYFPEPALFTLTVDRSNFSGPEHAHQVISGGQYVRRLLGELGVKSWVWVLEFQQATGDGWPHWHILIDRTALPDRGRIRHFLDLKKAWATWRDRWHLGGLDFAPKRETQTAAHAVNYITKYLMKNPPAGYPNWVLERGKRLRFVQGSKGLGALVGNGKKAAAVDEELGEELSERGEELSERRSIRPLIERMAGCQEESNVYAVLVNHATGEQSTKYVGRLPVGVAQLEWWAKEEEWFRGAAAVEDVYGRESLVLNIRVDEARQLIERHGCRHVASKPERAGERVESLLVANRRKNNQPCPL
jgi:hypothetical protein